MLLAPGGEAFGETYYVLKGRGGREGWREGGRGVRV
jgi:hypothetical protein